MNLEILFIYGHERFMNGSLAIMKVFQINSSDVGGGAEKICFDIHNALLAENINDTLFVGTKRSSYDTVIEISQNSIKYFLSKKVKSEKIRRSLNYLFNPYQIYEKLKGCDFYSAPSFLNSLISAGGKPDIIHCHNLHGYYCDLDFIRSASSQFPILLTLHDAWLLSGHCAHSFGCMRWGSGCGACPDLKIYPRIFRDNTAANYLRKKEIFLNSRFYLATPSRWLMDKVDKTFLSANALQKKVIPNGIDLNIFFQVKEKDKIKLELDLPLDKTIVLFSAANAVTNKFKDYAILRKSFSLYAKENPYEKILLIVLGSVGKTEKENNLEVVFVPFERNPIQVAQYYQAADIYAHFSKEDTFPTSVLEALACGIPVVATAVGGIPEQVKPLRFSSSMDFKVSAEDNATGILVTPSDADAVKSAFSLLIKNKKLRLQMGENACRDAKERFDFKVMFNRYIEWYREIIETKQR